MNKDLEKELLKALGEIGLEFESFEAFENYHVVLPKLYVSEYGVRIEEVNPSGTIEIDPAYDLMNKDSRTEFIEDFIDNLSSADRYINRNNRLLMYSELYHRAKTSGYGFAFERIAGSVMINGRLIVFFPVVDLERPRDFDRLRVIVYKSNNIRKKDIIFSEAGPDIFYLADEVIKLCD